MIYELAKLFAHSGMQTKNRTNGGSSGSKCELEEPADKISTRSETIKEEALITDEALLRRVCATVGKGISDRPIS